jgi:glycosyl transferase family 25
MTNEIYVNILNLAHRDDRRLECEEEFSKLGWLAPNRSYFNARHTPDDGALGCALSHGHALSEYMYTSSHRYVLILEDDFTVSDPERFLVEISRVCAGSEHWDVCLLAHNRAVPVERTQLPNWYRVWNSQTASGYLVRREYTPKLIYNFYRSAELLRKFTSIPESSRRVARNFIAGDMLWKELQIADRYITTFPALITQRPSYSDIEKTEVDYRC